jgi:outer membrane protein
MVMKDFAQLCKASLVVLPLLSSPLALAQTPVETATEVAAAGITASSIQQGIGITLEDFFTSALEYSPRLQAAEERWKIGSARRRGANGQLLPQVSASASISDNEQDNQIRTQNYRGERYSVQLRQVLFDWRVFSQRSQAYLLENQYEAEYYAELAALLTLVAERYLGVLQAEDALESSRAELEAIRSQLAQVERMYSLQMVQVTDLYDAQARMAAVEAEQLYLSSEVTLAREALRAVSGLSVGSLFTLGDDAELPQIEGNVDEWVVRANEGNHSIRAREIAVEIADERVSEQRGNYMPRVSLIMQQQSSDLGYDNTLIGRTDTGYIGVDVTVPLFTGGSTRAAVSEAVSMQSIARSELRQLNLDVSEQTRLSFLRLKSAERQIGAAEKLLESRELSTTASRRGFELGTVTSVEVLDKVRDQFLAERDLLRIRYEYLRLSLQLRRDAGSLSADDLVDISRRLIPPAG